MNGLCFQQTAMFILILTFSYSFNWNGACFFTCSSVQMHKYILLLDFHIPISTRMFLNKSFGILLPCALQGPISSEFPLPTCRTLSIFLPPSQFSVVSFPFRVSSFVAFSVFFFSKYYYLLRPYMYQLS